MDGKVTKGCHCLLNYVTKYSPAQPQFWLKYSIHKNTVLLNCHYFWSKLTCHLFLILYFRASAIEDQLKSVEPGDKYLSRLISAVDFQQLVNPSQQRKSNIGSFKNMSFIQYCIQKYVVFFVFFQIVGRFLYELQLPLFTQNNVKSF